MSTQEQVQSISLNAGEDLSAAQYLFGELDLAGNVDVADTLGVDAIGVIYTNPVSGEAVQIAYAGVAKVKASAAIAVGAKVAAAADGRAVTAGSGHHVLGRALVAAGAADEVIPVLLGSEHLLV